MSILVIADHNNSEIKPVTFNVLAAAKSIGGDIDVLVAGEGCASAADAASKAEGVSKVLLADNAAYGHHLAENLSLLVADLGKSYSHILTSAATTGKDFLPRVAALLDVAQLSDVIRVESADTFVRPIYAGNAIATVQSSASVESIENVQDAGISSFVGEEMAKSDRPELTAASIVISGGRGMQNGDNFKILESVADKLGAAVGASRAAVDAGFVPNDMQVGQTGKIVAPDLYIAVGISGAIQHLAGMSSSKVIVAINKDEDAPIFQVADYGLVADLFEAVPELDAAL
jgi:electron transfer flavoprotein alpha subunit